MPKISHFEVIERPMVKEIPHKEFAKRMQQAVDGNRDVPLLNFGRLQYFTERLENDFKIEVTKETIRRWFSGESLPRHKAMSALASILKVDEAWLSVGKASEVDSRQAKVRNAMADGVVNVVAGYIQMHGSNPAFPVAGDKRAEKEHIDIYAIIKGAQYAFHVVLGVNMDDGWRFNVPVGAENTFIIGVAPIGELCIEMIEIDPDHLREKGSRKGGHYELNVDAEYGVGDFQFKKIENFRDRL